MTQRIEFKRTGFVSGGELQCAQYVNGGACIVVNGGADPATHTKLTINPDGFTLGVDEVCIKTYGGREGVEQQLVALGVISLPLRFIPQGFVDVPVCKLLVDLPEYRR